MKISRLLLTLLPLMCIACAPKPLIYDPSDTKDHPTGNVQSLDTLLSGASKVRLILVHGVGDHCPGYALDPEEGWLKTKNAKAMGLVPVPGEEPNPQFVDVSVYMGGKRDGRSGVWYSTRRYQLTSPGRKDIPVEAIEITWSPLTQWIKTVQLGYDSPSAFTDKHKPECLKPIATDKPTVEAARRALLNKTIKEQVFDRNLADAMLYVGTYRETIERGLAEGICHAVTQTPRNTKCSWPSAEGPATTDYKNVFVTHSLGSRMTYDMFLDLMTDPAVKNSIFSDDERVQARPFIGRMLTDTPAIYMMANQLVLLGLANAQPSARSTDTTMVPYKSPVLFKNVALRANESSLSREATSVPALKSPAPGEPESPQRPSQDQVLGNVLLKIADLKAQTAEETNRPSASLEIVSFNDTNDLLTWHVPRAYVNDKVDSKGRPLRVNVTDVFVNNAPRWFYVLELPNSAHGDYFSNPDVRDIIRCGGSKETISRCGP